MDTMNTDKILGTRKGAIGTLTFNYPENKSFRDALSKAGFYKEWAAKFGDEAMAKLEKYSGKLA